MKPMEIQQLVQQSPALREAIKTEKAAWDFFRHHVQLPANQEEAWIMPVCRNCLSKDEDAKETYPLLQHPYDFPDYGWCVDCVLHAFQADTPFWQPPEPDYIGPDWWGDYEGEGPEMAIG